MKLFLSWSGEVSSKVANAFRDWIPSVIQTIVPYLSAEDIEKGARWSANIAKELEDSHYGIIIVTKDNMHAPWINFEAGALSKSIEKAHVTPFLFGLKNSELKGPLTQFQSTLNEKEDINRLIKSINSRMPEGQRLREQLVEKAFEVFYPELQNTLQTIEKTSSELSTGLKKSHKSQAEVLEEVVTQQRILNQQLQMTSEVMHATLARLQEHLTRLSDEFRMLNRRSKDASLAKRLPDLHHRVVELELSVSKAQLDGKSDLGEIIRQTTLLHEILHNADRYCDEVIERETSDGGSRYVAGRKKPEIDRPILWVEANPKSRS